MPDSKAKLKKLVFIAVILVIVIMMATRGCPRVRRSGRRIAYDPGYGMSWIGLHQKKICGNAVGTNIVGLGGLPGSCAE
jgi:hypothetical protein